MTQETIPKLSMKRSARYVTQSSVYDSPLLGVLTDRRIAHYEKLGYYGEAAKRRALEREKKGERTKKRKILEEFLA